MAKSKKPVKTNERVKSGIETIDKMIGGFRKNSINLIAGSAGSGKTIMAMQFLVEGLKNGENVLYITFEEKKDKTYGDMLGFGWDLAEYEKKGKLFFIEYTPEQIKRLITEGGGEIETIIEKTKTTRLVIDSITSFALLYQDELTKKEAALAFFELISKWNCTAILTSQMMINETIISPGVEFEVDSITLLYHALQKGIRKRGIEIIKMRGTPTPEKVFPFKISKKGLEVNIKSVLSINGNG
ncbi:MAG: ATPase domain-containing protein [archaeon]